MQFGQLFRKQSLPDVKALEADTRWARSELVVHQNRQARLEKARILVERTEIRDRRFRHRWGADHLAKIGRVLGISNLFELQRVTQSGPELDQQTKGSDWNRGVARTN